MIRTVVLLLSSTLILSALDIKDAINLALTNSFNYKKQKLITQNSELGLEQAYAAYHPTIDLGYSYNKRDEVIDRMGQLKEDSTLYATISYNLFNGFKDYYTIKSASNLHASKQFQERAAKEDLKLDVKTLYINCLITQAGTKTYKEAYALYTKQYRDAQNFFKQGVIANHDLLEVEVEKLRAKRNLDQAKAAERAAKRALEKITGQKIRGAIKPIKHTKPLSSDPKRLSNRSELKALQAIMESYQNRAKASQSAFYPKVDTQLSFYKYGDGMRPSDRANYPQTQRIGSVNLSWTLYSGSRGRIDIATNRNVSNQYAMELGDLKEQIRMQYDNAKDQLHVTQLALKSSKKALESAKVNYRVVADKLKEGLGDTKSLIDANYLLTRAKEEYTTAYYDHYLAIARLERIIEK
jgi:outer membrane protein TolC